jgi:hypothetical protein
MPCDRASGRELQGKIGRCDIAPDLVHVIHDMLAEELGMLSDDLLAGRLVHAERLQCAISVGHDMAVLPNDVWEAFNGYALRPRGNIGELVLTDVVGPLDQVFGHVRSPPGHCVRAFIRRDPFRAGLPNSVLARIA